MNIHTADTASVPRLARAKLLEAALKGEGDPALIACVQERKRAIDDLVQHGRRRRYAMGVQQKLDRALEAYVRCNYTEWDPDAPEAERAKANAETRRMIDDAEEGRGIDVVILMAAANKESRAVWDRIRKTAESDMLKIVKPLPVVPFIERTHGLGLPGLAAILAETGTLDGYANPAKLWSRLGFAPHDGHAMSTWRREKWRPRALTKEEWIDHPFKPQRYAFMFSLAKPLRDHQWIGAKKSENSKGQPDGPYGQLYFDRRAYCEITHPDWTDGHRDKDALRIMFKRLLVHLWEAWMDTSFAQPI